MANPLAQFEIKPIVPLEIGGIDASLTNSGLFMIIVVLAATLFLTLSMRGRSLVPTRWQSLAEICYEFIANMVRDNVGNEGRRFFPFIFTLFMFVLFANMIGMIPYSFTVTSHLVITFIMAAFVFVGVTLIGLVKHGLGFFSLFLPHGTPWYVIPLLVPIEVLSYFIRPVSLSFRLFANMTAGHTLLKVFAGFVVPLGFIGGWMPLAFVGALTGLEIIIAFLQAYVFTILSCIYLNDALHLH
ncbi:F0F1 ATP synthase subunit A [Magnetospira sp. QH-2]|uniref:F0F1 ATP synthase subunit A n=1 Tax=Magnetospira sp. (strain QH-2) TaxID=1288970 RepID=UPI0003E81AC4|nr:F0F1 ATP synthase subunit A [Magnetospira sp. QH-2]CCQ72666.1 ATP synthase subunit A, membrane-bound, F0 sector [Magnetospira sp. QH-2]